MASWKNYLGISLQMISSVFAALHANRNENFLLI